LNALNQYLKYPNDFANALNILIGYIAQEKGVSSDEIIKLIVKGGKQDFCLREQHAMIFYQAFLE